MIGTWTTDTDGNLHCAGCGNRGMVPCTVDHEAQVPNAEDEQGAYYFCEWDGEQGCDNTGEMPCLVCDNEANTDTYVTAEEFGLAA